MKLLLKSMLKIDYLYISFMSLGKSQYNSKNFLLIGFIKDTFELWSACLSIKFEDVP